MPYIILRGRWFHSIVLNVHAPTEYKIDDVKDSFNEELERIFNKFPKYHMKILLGDFNAEVGRENLYKVTVLNESIHEMSNNNGVSVVSITTSKYLIVKSTMFPHHNIHKYTWMSPDWKTYNQMHNILIERRRHSSVLDVQSLRAADCDMDQCLVVAKIKERITVKKHGSHKFHMERFSLKLLNEVDKYRVKVSNKFAAFEELDTGDEIKIIWETIRENITISSKESLGYYDLKQHKPWFD
jgi:hypothetical protein